MHHLYRDVWCFRVEDLDDPSKPGILNLGEWLVRAGDPVEEDRPIQVLINFLQESIRVCSKST